MACDPSEIKSPGDLISVRRLYLVRHAETPWNRDNRVQGHADLPLSPFGEQQAQCLGAFFAERHVRAVFTSALQRSQQTAGAIASGNGHGLSPVVEPELAEMHLGAWEGLTPAEIDARFQGAYQRWRTCPSSVVIPEAERLEDFRTRVRRTFTRIAGTLSEGEHVLVSHGGVIAALIADLLDADYDLLIRRLRLDNAGISAVELGVSPPHILWINATAHLKSLTPASGHAGWF